MSVSRASMQKISKAFFNLYNQHESDTDSFYETIKNCLNGIIQTRGEPYNIIPTPAHFRDDSVISSIDDLYSAAQDNEDLVGKVLYIRWYYHMTLLAMGSYAAKKVVDYIHKTTGENVTVKLTGSNFLYILDDVIKFSIRHVAGGGPFDTIYSGFGLYSPIWKDILETCVYTEGGGESLMRLEMPVTFEVFNELGDSTYWGYYVPLTDLGNQVKEHFITKIKQIIASK